MKEIKVNFKSKGEKVVGVLHTPVKPSPYAIIVIPGFRATKEHHVVFSRKLCKSGFKVLRLDLRGRGESEGVFEKMTLTDSISDVRAAIDFLNTPVGIFGTSYGGLVAIHVASFDNRVKALALRSPVTNIRTMFNGRMIKEVKRKGVFKYDTKWKGIIDIFTKHFVEDALKYDSFEAIKKIKVPIIMFHGEKDDIVPVQGTKKLFKNANEPKKLVLFPNESHGFTKNIYRKTENEIVKWFKYWFLIEPHTVACFLKHKGKILLLKRSKDVSWYKGKWSVINGRIEEGKKPYEVALQEIREETGIKKLKLIKKGKVTVFIDKKLNVKWYIHPFLFEVKSDKVRLNWENSDFAWVKPEEMDKYNPLLKLYKTYRKIVK